MTAAPSTLAANRGASASSSDAAALRRRLCRTAGWLAIAHVVLVFAGAAMTSSLQLGDPASAARDALMTSSLPSNIAGGFVSYLGFLVLLAMGLLLSQLFRGRDELTGWMSSCIAGSAVTAVATTIAAGFAAGAAAVYGGHHGAGLETITVVNDVRNFAFILTGGVVGLFLIAFAVAGRRTGLVQRSMTTTGMVLGIASVAAVPAARTGVTIATTMAWYVWLVAFGVTAVRRPGHA